MVALDTVLPAVEHLVQGSRLHLPGEGGGWVWLPPNREEDPGLPTCRLEGIRDGAGWCRCCPSHVRLKQMLAHLGQSGLQVRPQGWLALPPGQHCNLGEGSLGPDPTHYFGPGPSHY